MALPAHLIERLPQKLLKNGLLRLSSANGLEQSVLVGETEESSLSAQLCSGDLQGGVVELSIAGGAALGTSLALHACRFAQQRARELYGHVEWCAFIDPRGSLFAPGVAALGVDLSRLLVLRPDEQSLSRVALRVVEAQVFPVVVIDTMGIPGANLEVSLARWVQVVRRLSRAVNNTESTVVLLTDKHAKRPLPLPVTQRFEITRASFQNISVQVSRSRRFGHSTVNAQAVLRKPSAQSSSESALHMKAQRTQHD